MCYTAAPRLVTDAGEGKVRDKTASGGITLDLFSGQTPEEPARGPDETNAPADAGSGPGSEPGSEAAAETDDGIPLEAVREPGGMSDEGVGSPDDASEPPDEDPDAIPEQEERRLAAAPTEAAPEDPAPEAPPIPAEPFAASAPAPRLSEAEVEAILDGLNPPQREAVTHEGGPLLVLAGAGSGKTRVLTRRVAWLVGARGVSPGAILAVTFTNKAAAEMKERIVSLVGPHARNSWVGTFHSIGARILRRESERLGIARDFSIYNRDDQISALKRVLALKGVSPKEHTPDSFLSIISRAKNDLQSPDEFDASARGPFERLVGQVYRAYGEALRAQNALDFDDLLVLPVMLLRDENTRRLYSRRFEYVLVDEYQDTNKCQYEFLRSLSKDHRQLFVVGDDDQSIYRWRGADLSNILDFEADHEEAGVIRLEQNYRSTGRILAAANSVIRQNLGRKGKELWTENPHGEPLLVLDVPDEQTEAMTILKILKEAMAEENRNAGEFAILYRTNAQSRVLENTFQLGQVPYAVFGGQRFYERKEIRDALSFLRLVVNPTDDVAVRRVINVPPRGIGKKGLEDLQADALEKGDSLLAAMRRAVEGKGAPLRPAPRLRITEFFEILDAATERSHTRSVGHVMEKLLEELDYEAYLEKESEKQAYSRWENVQELLAAMQEFSDSPDREDDSVRAFLEEVSLVSDTDSFDADAPRVTLMTLHNAKGLEFPWVFLAGVEEGLFPHANSANEPGGLEEERRLFYVGITRAQQRVVLLNADSRRKWGGYQRCMPSRFLEEMDPEHVERRSLVPATPPPSRRSGGESWNKGKQWGAPRQVPVSRAEDVPDYIPSYEDESQEVVQVQPGSRVRHPSWGEGIVEAVEGNGEQLKLTIKFRGGVLKKVLAVYAKLELL
ncbi:MAG: DNA helicase [Gemmatimonadota bacterium]|nr:MAG: DNA helicase [Gemmatimonadota bacterium]